MAGHTLLLPFADDENSHTSLEDEKDYLEAVYEDWKPARPTKVFATYWRFAASRQDLFFRRLQGHIPPWTNDPILTGYRFTNVYRASDRVSQFLIRKVLYPEDGLTYSPEDIFFRTLVFKIFNKIDTWQLLEGQLGEIRWSSYSFDRYDAVLTKRIEDKKTIFSAAYIMPSGSSTFGSPRKHRNCLRLLEMMMADELPNLIAEANSLGAVFHMLRDYPLLGDFLAFQFTIDLNYSPLIDFAENTFVVAGPGAHDGIHKCFSHMGGLSEEDLIARITEKQADEFGRLQLEFQSLFGRPLQLIDCQNIFCEVSKYARVAHPDVAGASGRTRIKQAYHISTAAPLSVPFYPPKWGINNLIVETIQNGESYIEA